MSHQPTTRATDDKLLDMMTLRTRGWTAQEIGDVYGFNKGYVRAATNRVVTEDAKLHDDSIRLSL